MAFGCSCLGSGPVLLLLRHCLRGETQIWLGDLRVVLGLFGFLVLCFVISLPHFVTVQFEPLRSIRFFSSQLIQISGPSLRASSAIPGKKSKGSVWVLDEDAKRELKLLRFRVCYHPPRKLYFCHPEAPVFVFTDGACEPADDGSYVASI